MLGHGSQLKQTFVPLFQINRRIHIPVRFSSCKEVRQSLSTILIAVLYFIMEVALDAMGIDVLPPPPTASALEKQKILESALSDWVTSLEGSNDVLLKSSSQQERLCLVMLRIYADVLKIIVATCFATKETAFDDHFQIFESIVSRCKDVGPGQIPALNGTGDPCESCDKKHLPFFSIDTAFFPPLFFTVLKYRNHRTRQATLAILQEYRHMEGPWTGRMLAKVAGHVVELEESHFQRALQRSSSRLEPAAPVPPITEYRQTPSYPPDLVLPDFCRFHCVEFHLPNRLSRESNQ